MSGRVTIKCPICKEWMTKMDDLCEDCQVTPLTIKKKKKEE